MTDNTRIMKAVGKVAFYSRRDQKKPALLKEARQELLETRLSLAIEDALYPEKPYGSLEEKRRKKLARVLSKGPTK